MKTIAKVGDLDVTIYKFDGDIIWVKYPCFDNLLPVLAELIEVTYE